MPIIIKMRCFMNKKGLLSSIFAFFIIINGAPLYADSFFSGNAGGRLNYSPDVAAESYTPDLGLEVFFEGQFNFSNNVWSHLDFSIDTSTLLDQDFFTATDAKFKIDELSIISRAQIEDSANYLSAFMGTYDPVGSDIFFQRYFGMQPISSKITESWLGRSSSIIYPHFGIGISDILRLYNNPLAFGTYIYINNQDEKYYVLNFDLRFGCVYRYFSIDFAAGLGAPLTDKYNGEDAIVVIDKLYWHAGTTILIGNNFTQSLFIQAGIFNATFTKGDNNLISSPQDMYLLVEPRLKFKNSYMALTLYSLPQKTVDQLLFVNDTLGCNLNIYNDTLSFGSHQITLGTNFSLSFPDKNFLDLKDPLALFGDGNFNIDMTPYMSTSLLSGQLHMQFTVKFMEFYKSKWYNGITADIGYRTSF